MCFSSTASFTAAAVLSVASVASFSASKNTAQRFLSGITLLFAIQQFAEGMLWMSVNDADWSKYHEQSKYGFLVFAQVVWPTYVPLCILLFEKQVRRKKIITLLLLCGIVFSAYLSYGLYHYSVRAIVEDYHIRYDLGLPISKMWFFGLLYFIPTILAPLLSTKKILHWLGYLFLFSYIIARLMFHHFVISVWCFFGALISVLIYVMIRRMNKKNLAD